MDTARQYHKKCIQGVLQLKVHQGSVAIKSTARECHKFKYLRKCHNQKYCQGPPQSEALPWTAKTKKMQGSAAIKHKQGVQPTEVQQGSMTTRKCDIQMYCQCVSQSKTFQGSITIERTARTMKRFYNQNYFQECHNQKNFQGVS